MDKYAIEKRLTELKTLLAQTEANGNAIIGAIRECERWLTVLEEAEKKSTESDVK